jgi:hypothetical protein
MILVVDIDNTLLVAPRFAETHVVSGEIVTLTGLAKWEAVAARGDFPPVPGAVAGIVRELRGCEQLVLLTARSVRLEAATRANLRRYFPLQVSAAILSMGGTGPDSGGVSDKIRRLAALLTFVGAQPVRLIDDAASMRLVLRPTDEFAHAPGCWYFDEAPKPAIRTEILVEPPPKYPAGIPTGIPGSFHGGVGDDPKGET